MVNHFSPPGEEGKALVAEDAGPSLGQRLIEFLSKKWMTCFWWIFGGILEFFVGKTNVHHVFSMFFDEIPT